MAGMMRVGVDIRPLIFTRAGIYSYLLNLLKHMPGGAEFYLFTSSPSRINWGRSDFREVVLRLPHLNRFCERIWQNALLPAALRRYGIQVFHGPRFFLPRTAAAGVVSVHDCAFRKIPGLVTPRTAAYFDSLIRAGLARAKVVLTISDSTSGDVIELYGVPPGKIRMIYPACSQAFRPLDRDQAQRRVEERFGVKGPFLLSVGTLEPRKNIGRLLEAFHSLPGLKGLRLVAAGGKGWLCDRSTAKTGGRVVFPGYVSEEELVWLYNAAEAFVFPSLYEGFGIPVLEAMSCGCPVVCANNSSLKEIFADASLQVDASDTVSIAKGIEQVCLDKGLREDLRRRGLEKAGRFSWEKCGRETMEVYRSAAA